MAGVFGGLDFGNAVPALSALDDLLEGAQVIGRDWRYLYVNRAAARHGGRAIGELLGRTMEEAFPGIEQTPIFAVLRECMQTERRAELENEFVRPDGVARWFQLVVQPAPQGLFILSLDITDRKHAEEALQKTRARFEAAIENLQEGVILAELDGRLVHWNRAALAMLGFDAVPSERGVEDFAGMFEIYTADGRPVPAENRPMARVMRGEQFHDLELRVRRTGVEWERVFVYSGSVVRYADGGSLGLVTIRDITETKELERQFVRAQRMESIGELAGGVAHDLNNILMPIMMGVETLRRTASPRAQATIGNMESSVKRGAELVRQILSFARGAGADSAPVRMADIIAAVEPIVRSTFPRSIKLALDRDAPFAVIGDATQLLQVLLNLLVNARDAMPQGGRIAVSTEATRLPEEVAAAKGVRPGDYAVLQVRDEGLGMSAELLERIFEPFFTTKPSGKGTGLGLSTVRQIVRSHAGFVEVSSDPGRGTTFRVHLPAVDESLVAAAGAVPVEEIPRGADELIMIVDDEHSILTVAQETIESYGYRAVTAENGAQAMALFSRRSSEIALMIVDMEMPVVNGAALISAIRHSSRVPIIANSGSSNADWISRAMEAGATLTLIKPYTTPRLLRAVAEVLGKFRR